MVPLSMPRIVRVSAIVMAWGLMGALVAACAGPSGGGTYAVSAGGAQSCKQLQKRMNQLYARGKKDSAEYRRVLDTYIARGCYR